MDGFTIGATAAGVLGLAAGTAAVVATPHETELPADVDAMTRREMTGTMLGIGIVGGGAFGGLGAINGSPGMLTAGAFGIGLATGGLLGATVGAIMRSRAEAQ